ncbi:MAG: diacylglycerol kinase [Deltaproteobacteria bacterium]|nr:MAG: diacylglycerol kinase [Deltaproteobacteria bacterium]
MQSPYRPDNAEPQLALMPVDGPALPEAPGFRLPDEHFAVVLNANAGRVTPRVRRAISEVVPRDRLFFTESPEHAREVLEHCVEREVDTVFAGGGDGTIVGVINTLVGLRERADHLPDVGILRLGTGNALAHWMGSGRPLRDLRRWRSGRVHRAVPVRMVVAEDTLFPFAGLGYDAAILNDYNWLRQRARGRWWDRMAHGVPGYLLAGYLRTLPNYLRRDPARVTVYNLGGPAQRIGPDGRPEGDPIDTGEIIYQGPATMIGAASTPLYGAGMKMFPFATSRAGRFQLRIAALTPLEAARNLVPLWKGTLRHERLQDFWVDRVRLVFDEAMPYQLGGEARGYRQEMTFGLAEHPVTLVGQA